ncbi:MAG: hypothetical protein IVW57_07940 [Ktedonobacterales bacterium]|nr:hypothetical protein [Ktedonobacterales bacterium]
MPATHDPNAHPLAPADTSIPRHDAAARAAERGHLATAYVIEPGGPAHRYSWDPQEEVLVCDGILSPDRPRGADLARLPLIPPRQQPRADDPDRPAWARTFASAADTATDTEISARLGPSLLAIVLTRIPHPPGTRVRVRLLGAIYTGAREGEHEGERVSAGSAAGREDLFSWLAITLPAADPTLAEIGELATLPDALRGQLQRALASMRMESALNRDDPAPWLSADDLAMWYRAARRDLRLARRAEHAAVRAIPSERLFAHPEAPGRSLSDHLAAGAPDDVPAAPAWREIHHLSPAEVRARGMAAYAEGEHLRRWIPSRFERYVSELVPPDEEILFFAECPALTLRGWSGHAVALADLMREARHTAHGPLGRALGRLRVRKLHQGLFLITTHQVLLLRDYVPPDAALVDWGYVARSWPLGRLRAVSVLPPGATLDQAALSSWPTRVVTRLAGTQAFDEATLPASYARLVVGLEAARGVELSGFAVPPDGLPLLERAANRLASALPWPSTAGAADRRLRLTPAVAAWTPTEREAAALETLGDLVPAAEARALALASAAEVLPDEVVLVQARTPALRGDGGGAPALLTLTGQRLLLASRDPQRGHRGGAPTPVVISLPLPELASVSLQHSLLGCYLTISLPIGAPAPEVRQITTAFPSPLIVPFRALSSRLRVLLNGPLYRDMEECKAIVLGSGAP